MGRDDVTLDRLVGDGLAPALSAPDETDRFGHAAAAGRLAAIGLAVSIIGHVILIGLGIVKLESTGTFEPNVESIPIQLVPDPSVSTNKNPKVAPVVAPKPDSVVQSKPAPTRSAQPEMPQPPAQVGPQPPAPVDATSPSQGPTPQDARSPRVATTGTIKTKMTQSEVDALRAQIQRCWSVPQGWTDPKQVSVVVDFQMSVDGAVTGRPTVIEFQANRYGVAAAQNAVRAVLQCGPYRLPASKYSDWREAQVRLTPGG
jgi:hypothetical protein